MRWSRGMRRPLVAVVGLAAALLVAGGIAATTAGADVTPDVPSIPAMAVPAVPELPHLPGGDGWPGGGQDQQAGGGQLGQDQTGQDRTGQDQTGPDQTGPDQTGPDRTGPDAAIQNGPDQSDPDQSGPDQSGQDGQSAHDSRTPHRPGGPVTTGTQGGTSSKPAASVLAAAQRDVSP